MEERIIKKQNRNFEILFDIGMYWRTVYGFIKLILGITLLNFINMSTSDLFNKILSNEITEDPSDIFVKTIGFFIDKSLTHITYFIPVYLIFWGFVDAFLSINILKQKLWAYKISIFLISIFVLYEIYRYTHTHSLILLFIILIDLFIIWLIGKEYKILVLEADPK